MNRRATCFKLTCRSWCHSVSGTREFTTAPRLAPSEKSGPRRHFDRLSNRLAKSLSEARKLNSPGRSEWITRHSYRAQRYSVGDRGRIRGPYPPPRLRRGPEVSFEEVCHRFPVLVALAGRRRGRSVSCHPVNSRNQRNAAAMRGWQRLSTDLRSLPK
jgi:hypothetical protein